MLLPLLMSLQLVPEDDLCQLLQVLVRLYRVTLTFELLDPTCLIESLRVSARRVRGR